MIVFRYLCKEIYISLLAITGILLFVCLSNQFVSYITQAAAGELAISAVFKIMGIMIPFFLSFLLPLGLFLSILLVYGRMYVESEMTVLSACGFSHFQLVKATLILSLGVFIIVGYLALIVNPKVQEYRHQMLDEAGAQVILQTLMPGRFQATPDGKYVFYVKTISRDRKQMTDLFAAQYQEDKKNKQSMSDWDILAADDGHVTVDPATGAEYVVTGKGHYYQGQPGGKQYQIVGFAQLGIRLVNQVMSKHLRSDSLPTSYLISHSKHSRHSAAELEWRLSMPIAVIILVLLAVPLSRVKPKQGKFFQLVPAILLYVFYANLIGVTRQWIRKGELSPGVGMWWVHGLFLLLAIGLLLHQFGWRRLMNNCLRFIGKS